MKRALSLLVGNLAVFIVLLLALNVLVIVVFQAYQGYKWLTGAETTPAPVQATAAISRLDLPNYQNIDWAETYFREYRELTSEYRAFVGWKRRPYVGETINIDDQGIRRTPQYSAVADDTPLAVFLGGSAMWGVGASDGTTIPAQFSRLAEGAYRTMNLGVGAYNAYQGFQFLKLVTMQGETPDLIISYDGVNESQKLFPGNGKLVGHGREAQVRNILLQNYYTKARQQQPDAVPPALTFGHMFVEPLRVFAVKLGDKLDIQWLRNDEPEPGLRRRYEITDQNVQLVAAGLLESWLSTKQLADHLGAEFVAALQPHSSMGTPRLDHIETDPEMDKAVRRIYGAVRELLDTPRYAALRPHFIDLTRAFDGDDYIYIDRTHVSPNGNAIIARQLLERLRG